MAQHVQKSPVLTATPAIRHCAIATPDTREVETGSGVAARTQHARQWRVPTVILPQIKHCVHAALGTLVGVTGKQVPPMNTRHVQQWHAQTEMSRPTKHLVRAIRDTLGVVLGLQTPTATPVATRLPVTMDLLVVQIVPVILDTREVEIGSAGAHTQRARKWHVTTVLSL